MGVLLQRPQNEFRLVVHIWKEKSRVTYTEYLLANDKITGQLLQPGDVIILGVMDDKRRRLIEQIPTVARVLARSPASKHDSRGNN